jgi:hypothetical protein
MTQGREPSDPDRSERHMSTPESAPATPRWVILLAVLAAVLILAFVVLVVAGGHDPSRFQH